MRTLASLLGIVFLAAACGGGSPADDDGDDDDAPPGDGPGGDGAAPDASDPDAATDARIDATPTDAPIDGIGIDGNLPVGPLEVEPNEDGTPSVGMIGTRRYNDFNATARANADANGAIDAAGGPARRIGALIPAGDEDVFAVTNTTGAPVVARVDTWGFAGLGVPCDHPDNNTVLHLFDAAGRELDFNDSRDDSDDTCSHLDFHLAAGQTAYVLVQQIYDDAAIAGYALELDFAPAPCGDGISVPAGEQCDDANAIAGDGCDPSCQLEGVTPEIEPNSSPQGVSQPVAVPARILGSLTIGNIVDDYQYQLPAPVQVVRMETYNSVLPLACTDDLDLYLNFDWPDGTSVHLTSDTALRCDAIVVPLENGIDYYPMVRPYFDGEGTSEYILDIKIDEPRGGETEAPGVTGANDTRATAETMLLGSNEVWVSGDHTVATDVDYYAITVPAGRGVRAEVIEGDVHQESCLGTTMRPRLELYDQNGVQLAFDNLHGHGNCPMIDGTLHMLHPMARNPTASTQTYYLAVSSPTTTATDANQFVYRLDVVIR